MSVQRETHGPICLLTLDAPPEHALSSDVAAALTSHLRMLNEDATVDVVVVRAAEGAFFCGGGIAGEALDAPLDLLAGLPQYTIAALGGHAHGAGLHLALACDVRVARASAAGSRPTVGFPVVDAAALPGPGARARLVATMGASRALAWLAEGRSLSVEDAAAIGLVSRVLPPQSWHEQLMAIAAAYGRPSAAAAVVRAWKTGGAQPVLDRPPAPRPAAADARPGPDAARPVSPTAQGPAAAAPEPTPAPLGPRRGAALASAPLAPRPSAAADALAPFTEPTEPDDDPVSAPPPRRPGAGYASSTPRSAAERGAGEFAGFEDFADFGDEDVAPEGAFGAGHRWPGIDLTRTRISDATLNLLTRDLVERHRAIPVRHDDVEVVVAMVDPGNTAAVAEIAGHTGRRVVVVRAPVEEIAALVGQHYRA
jgi:enoyl-CoA hydratase/carnithine racemase